MNPNKGSAGGSGEAPVSLPAIEKVSETDGSKTEAIAGVEAVPSRQTSAPAIPSAPIIIPDANPVQLPVPAQDSPATADDTIPVKHADRIEKSWVERAKAIVEQSKDDPFKQKDEMSKVKAEYIKKRFNKTVKTDTGAV